METDRSRLDAPRAAAQGLAQLYITYIPRRSYVYINTAMCIYIYIYIYNTAVYVCIYIYIYIQRRIYYAAMYIYLDAAAQGLAAAARTALRLLEK